MNARFDFLIQNVPSEETASLIARAFENVLREQFSTDMWISPTLED